MRNLTQEAIEYAEAVIIQTNPPLANDQIRSQLPEAQKMMIVSQLNMLHELYMTNAIEEIKHKYDNNDTQKYDTIEL